MKHKFKTTTGKQLRLSEEEIRMVLSLESRGFGVDHIETVDGTTTVRFLDGTVSTYVKILAQDQPEATPTLFDRIVKALFSLRPVYITDGTVTRLLTAADHIGSGEIRCQLDNGSFLYLYPGFEKDLDGEIGLMEADEGYYLAPQWWIDL